MAATEVAVVLMMSVMMLDDGDNGGGRLEGVAVVCWWRWSFRAAGVKLAVLVIIL